MKCTRCWKFNGIKIDWNISTQKHSGLVADPVLYNVRLCTDCIVDLFKSIWDQLDESTEIKLTQRYGEIVMPKAYIKMRNAMKKQYGPQKGTEIAAKTWNKAHKGTGKTVGKGRS